MYKISVPIIYDIVDRQGRDGIVKKLRELDAERVFLALGVRSTEEAENKKTFEILKRETEYFHSLGYEVGVWLWTFMLKGENSFTHMTAVSVEEKVLDDFYCPTDEDYVADTAAFIAGAAATGVDMIMFDDDFRYGCLGGGVACLCPHHVQLINEKVGENLTRAELAEKILTGNKNKYRDAWIETNGGSFRAFARAVRAAVDGVNPRIRMGACACLSSWDLDGVDAYELATILAGDTKPFVRLIGAAYWPARGSWGTRIGDVIEQERMEEAWTRKGEIEVFSEGDAFPRPRTVCPAAYLEGMDTALRADGRMDGMLKYAIDYTSSADYENGYVERHLRNKPTYEGIEKIFSGKEAVGVRNYAEGSKVAYMELGDTPATGGYLYYSYFSSAARSFAATSIPTCYYGEGVVGACYGEAAWSLPEGATENGLILDAVAARILHQNGVDVGIRSLGNAVSVSGEIFVADNERIDTYKSRPFDHVFSDDVHVESYGEHDGKKIPMSYTYENANGDRFLVLNFDTRSNSRELYAPSTRHYARSRQYAEAVKWLSKGEKALPAYSYGNPDLYILAKKDEDGAMAVGLWNFCIDWVYDPKITLDREYKEISFLNCSGSISGNVVTLSDLSPFGFCAFEVK